jgi:hypothetical protein
MSVSGRLERGLSGNNIRELFCVHLVAVWTGTPFAVVKIVYTIAIDKWNVLVYYNLKLVL